MADASDYLDLDPADGSHILLITAPYYRHIVDELERGAAATIAEFGATFEKVSVGGAVEMPGGVSTPASRPDRLPESSSATRRRFCIGDPRANNQTLDDSSRPDRSARRRSEDFSEGSG